MIPSAPSCRLNDLFQTLCCDKWKESWGELWFKVHTFKCFTTNPLLCMWPIFSCQVHLANLKTFNSVFTVFTLLSDSPLLWNYIFSTVELSYSYTTVTPVLCHSLGQTLGDLLKSSYTHIHKNKKYETMTVTMTCRSLWRPEETFMNQSIQKEAKGD